MYDGVPSLETCGYDPTEATTPFVGGETGMWVVTPCTSLAGAFANAAYHELLGLVYNTGVVASMVATQRVWVCLNLLSSQLRGNAGVFRTDSAVVTERGVGFNC